METGRESIGRLTSELRAVFDETGRWGDLYLSLLSVFAANELGRVCDGRLYGFVDEPEPVNISRSPHNKYRRVLAFAVNGEYLFYRDRRGRRRKVMLESAYPTDLLSIVTLIEAGRWSQRDEYIIEGAME